MECDSTTFMKKMMIGFVLAVQPVTPVSLGLGTSAPLNVTVTADAESQGNVELSVDSSGLTQDPDHDVSFAVSPSHISLTPGQSAQAKLTITTKTSAPDFQGGKITIRGKMG